MEILEAIRARHSVREYLGRPIDRDTAGALSAKIKEINIAGNLHAQLVLDEPKAFLGPLAKYGKFRNVTNYIVMAGKEDARSDESGRPCLEERVGYYGEQLVIYAQTLGLNTCWVGLSYSKVPGTYTLEKGEKIICYIAIGYGATQGVAHKTKTIEELSNAGGGLPEWFTAGVEAARLAPTAVNQQKFFFEYAGRCAGSKKDIVEARRKFSVIGYTWTDLGIAKYHFEAGAGKENFEWRQAMKSIAIVLLCTAGLVFSGQTMYSRPVTEAVQNGNELTVNSLQQKGILHGTVSDETGPVIGASATVSGSMNGTVTDLDGHFTLEGLVRGDVITISCIGYENVEIVYSGQDNIAVRMNASAEFLDATVVTALGIKRSEKALSYNVQSVDGSSLTAVKDANFINSLNGKVAGVTINAGASGSGSGTRVVMRGVKSITKSNLALYVIDGLPMYNLSSGGSGSIYSDQPGTDGVADLNPEDIESITMLTGPSAAALYGNAAAAGAVLITTKKGEAGKTTVTYSNTTTFSRVSMMPQMQSRYGNAPNDISSWGEKVDNDYDPADFFRTGVDEINSISFSTGNSRNQTYASASSTNSTNILPNSGYNRYNFSARNTSTFLNDRMVFDFGASYILQNDKNLTAQGLYYNPLPGLYLMPRSESFENVRIFERWDEAKGYNVQYWPYGSVTAGLQNPYWVQHRELRENKKTRYMLNASLKFIITPWLNIAGRVKVDNYANRLTYKMYASTDENFSGENGNYRDVQTTLKSTYADIMATVDKRIRDWSLNINLGASIDDSREEYIGYDGGLDIPNFFAVHNIKFERGWKPKQGGWHDQAQAIFINAEVGWKSIIYLTATGRVDWESELAYSNYSCFMYPSVGISAVLSSLFDAPDWLSFLKVRASYAEVGNSYGRYMTTASYPYDEQSKSWSTTTSYPNYDLKPERTKSWEAGIDANFFNDLSLKLTYYHSNTFNQTFYASLPSSSGYTSIPIQSGNIMNEGIEAGIGYDHKWGGFSFGAHYTFTWNRNEVKRLADGAVNPFTGETIRMEELTVGGFGQTDAKVILRTGGSTGDVYAQKKIARDLNGYILNDPNTGLSVTSGDYFKIGSILPKANMGLSLDFGWKGIALGMTFNARLGGIVMSETQATLDRYGVSEASAAARDNGGVRINSGLVTAKNYYQTTAGIVTNYTYDATNVRLGQLNLNYTLPRRWFRDKCTLNVGFIAKNLWMIYCKAPFDPELTTAVSSNYYQSFDSFMLPSTRTMGFNVRVQF